MQKQKVARIIHEHPDREEIISKLLSGVSCSDISEWLEYRYTDVGEKKFLLSEKTISSFQKDYLDMYSMLREDAEKIKKNNIEEELKLEIQGNPQYHKALETYVNSEIDIKTTVKKLVAAIEIRASQVFDLIQEDPRNIKMDRTLVEWFNTLTAILEKYDTILNGNPDQINIQNNINIQVVDSYINVVYNAVVEVLSKLDYDTSLLFIDLFNDSMKKLKASDKILLPQEERLEETKILNEAIMSKLDK